MLYRRGSFCCARCKARQLGTWTMAGRGSARDIVPCSVKNGPSQFEEYTRRVEVSTVAYNQNFGLVSLVSVNFFINKAGHVHKLLWLS